MRSLDEPSLICPICKGYKTKKINDPDFVRCTSCGLLRRSPRPTVAELAAELEKLYVTERPNDDYANQVNRALGEMPLIRQHCSRHRLRIRRVSVRA